MTNERNVCLARFAASAWMSFLSSARLTSVMHGRRNAAEAETARLLQGHAQLRTEDRGLSVTTPAQFEQVRDNDFKHVQKLKHQSSRCGVSPQVIRVVPIIILEGTYFGKRPCTARVVAKMHSRGTNDPTTTDLLFRQRQVSFYAPACRKYQRILQCQ